jgi:hypothetical protein
LATFVDLYRFCLGPADYPEWMISSESGSYAADPVGHLRGLPLGSRVVVRIRLAASPDAGAPRLTDALGYLRHLDASECVIETKRGDVLLRLADVVAVKEVPPPPMPMPRTARRPAEE